MSNNDDEIYPFLGMVLAIMNMGHYKPLFAKLIKIGPEFLTFERRDGQRVLIKRKAIMSMAPINDGVA
jgi:hypothetical protein